MARRRRNRNVFRGEPDGLQPGDSVGNRKPKQAQRLPPDDIGNRKSDEPGARLPPDDIGNRIDSMPTHELSGVLMELDARKGRRNKKRNGRGETVRMGRYVLGGVNPLVAGDTQRAQKAQDEAHEKQKADRREDRAKRKSESGGGGGGGGPSDDDGGRRSDRRRQRFFDFVDDDRYDYQLQSDPEEKRALAEETVQEIVTRAGRAAACVAHVIEDGSRPKVLVTIDEWGPTGTVKNGKPEGPQLFGLGAAALMSLNYLVNKIVNRFPKDRIRLAVLPQSEEAAYRESLAEHRAAHPDDKAPAQADKGEKKPQKAQKADAADDVPAASGAGDKPAKVKKVRASKKASSDEPAAAEATAADAEGATDEAPAKKATAKKAPAKKATAKKAPAKKAAAKKAPAKKATAKKAPAKKATAKKAPAKKATAKKAPAKKATKKKTSADE